MYQLNDIEAVIFDIDGTLLDSMPIWKEACSRYLISLGITPEENLNEIVFTMTIKEGIKYTKERYSLDMTEEELEKGLLENIKDFYYNEAMAKDGVVNLVKEFSRRNIPMILATTGDADLATHALSRIGIMDCFMGILTCNEYNTNKGEPLIFDLAKDMLSEKLYKDKRLEYKNVCVFEDSLKAIKTVKKMGFTVVAVKDAESSNQFEEIEKTAGVLLDSLAEVVLG